MSVDRYAMIQLTLIRACDVVCIPLDHFTFTKQSLPHRPLLCAKVTELHEETRLAKDHVAKAEAVRTELAGRVSDLEDEVSSDGYERITVLFFSYFSLVFSTVTTGFFMFSSLTREFSNGRDYMEALSTR